MKYYDTKIYKIICNEFDSRMELAVLSYIMEKGIENLKCITEDDIISMPHTSGDFMTPEFCQALVRAAVKICNECDTFEIMTYIRCCATFAPNLHDLILYESWFTSDGWEELLYSLSLDDKKEEEDEEGVIELFAIVPSNI